MIEVLKASAGSGKTFALAKTYIEMLLKSNDRYAYRHILAVTFTNKATDEMKQRILSELHILATRPAESDYIGDFVPALFPTEALLQKAAETVLCNILHDYSAFSVSTIDKFFQQALKAFSREIGQFASYQVSLDRDGLVAESVDRVLDSLTDSKKDQRKLDWLTSKTIQDLEAGNGYKLESTLYSLAARLKSEQHRRKVEECGVNEEEIYSEEGLKKLLDGCNDVLKRFPVKVAGAAKAVLSELSACSLAASDTERKFMEKPLQTYSLLNEGDAVKAPTAKFIEKCLKDSDEWFIDKKASLRSRVSQQLVEAVHNLVDVLTVGMKTYNTADMLKSQIYGFGMANDIYNEFNALLKEKNVLSLDDTNSILKGIIDGTEAPFIYEKLGVRYEHFLLDEFQDTSSIQWNNFQPLVHNSVANGSDNLIVGDVKQSIYRWRGSDWDLLNSEIPAEFAGNIKVNGLDTNWRSRENIVEFNNDFFRHSAEVLQEMLDPAGSQITDIYADVKQKVAKKNLGGGSVGVSFVDIDDELDKVLELVNEAHDGKGFGYKDIAVLTRGKDEGSAVAQKLIGNGIPVVTDDSLKIKSSITVRRLSSLLSSIDNPGDTLSRYLAKELRIELPEDYHSIVDLCEHLLRELQKADPGIFEAETLYIQSYMDKVLEYTSTEGNGLHAFLQAMEEDDSSISSPSIGDSVRIMTIHKSKGLDFPYVIVPFFEGIGLYRTTQAWCKPDVAGTELESAASGVYDVYLSGKSDSTLFASEYHNEYLMQLVDNINVAYVALTRASQAMHIVAVRPDENRAQLNGADGENKAAADFSEILYHYIMVNGDKFKRVVRECETEDGEETVCETLTWFNAPLGDFIPKKKDKDDAAVLDRDASYGSWPLGERLTFSTDAVDFFSEDGETGISASVRRRGIVLHGILSSIGSISDVPAAVQRAVLAGNLPAEDAESVIADFEAKIRAVQDRGWFPEDPKAIRNEAAIIDSEGEKHRPDRVVRTGDSEVTIIDYKFGTPTPENEERMARKYRKQVRGYMDLYRNLGYKTVRGFVWYVPTNQILDA